MRSLHHLTVQTHGPAFHEITADLSNWLRGIQAVEGVLTLLVRHTSCSLLIQENADPDVQHDMLEWLSRIAPPSNAPGMGWMRHTAEGPDDMPAHLKAAILPVSLSIPVSRGRMVLGTWQGVYLVEHRRHPHRREIVAKFQADD